MKYLVFDTETTGLPVANAPIEEQPFMLELGAILVDDDLISILGEQESLLWWEGLEVKEGVHGITQARINEEGEPPLQVMKEFDELVRQSDIVCAFNLNFDEHIILNSYLRVGGTGGAYRKRRKCCILQSAREICAIPYSTGVDTSKKGAKRFKSPSLKEAVDILCEKGLTDAHTALGDTRDALDVLFQLVHRDIPLIYEQEELRLRPVTHKEDVELLKRVIELSNNGQAITREWDLTFVMDFASKYNRYQGETFISPAQRKHLLRIKAYLEGV